MKYIIGSLIISFGLLMAAIILLVSLGVKAPDNIMEYLGLAWVLLAIAAYPLARKIIRA
jgi:hypothetical protein